MIAIRWPFGSHPRMKGVFLVWTFYPCRRSAQKRPTPSPLSLFLRPILNHGVRRRPQDLGPRGKAPTRFSQMNGWYCSNDVMWIACDMCMSIWNLTNLDCKVFFFWSNRQHDQTFCRLVLLRVLSPKDSWGRRELAQANCEDEGWQFWWFWFLDVITWAIRSCWFQFGSSL